MAEVILDIGGFRYPVSCRDGEQEHFRTVGAIVEEKVQQARGALGGISEARQLLFAALLLADSNRELTSRLIEAETAINAGEKSPPLDVEALEALASRIEMLASQLENRAGTP